MGQTVVQEAVARLREACACEKREIDFAIFEAYDLSPDAEASYASVARKLGISESDVTNRLFQVRRRFRAAVEEVVRDAAANDRTKTIAEIEALSMAPELQAEARFVLGIVLFASGDPASAASLFEQAVRVRTGSVVDKRWLAESKR